MTSVRKWGVFLMAFAFAAFSLPALAHYVTLEMAAGAPGQLTAKITNKTSGGNYTINSIKLPFGTNVGGVASVAVTAYTGTGSTSGVTVTPTIGATPGYISVPNVSLANNKSITLTLSGVTTSSPTCASTSTTWTVKAYENSNYSGYLYLLPSTGNVFTASVKGSCTLTYSAGTGGTITGATPQTVAYGGSGTQVTAVPNAGYNFGSWSDSVATAARTDTNVTANKSVTASFVQIIYTINGSTSAGGTVTCGPTSVTYGQSSLCSVVVNPGYTLTGFSANCGAPTTATSCTVSNVQSTQTVTASFAQIPYAIDGSTAAGGSVTCAPSSVTYGQSSVCSVTVNNNFTFTGFSANCGAPSTATSCTVSNVQSSLTVTANFNANTLAISSTQTSAAKGVAFPVKVTLAGGPQDATVTLVPAGCPPIAGVPAALSAAASGGVAMFNLTFTDVGACSLTATATNYSPSGALSFAVFAVADPGCDPDSTTFPTSTNPGDPALDPDNDTAYLTTGWGLRRYGDTNAPGCTAGANFTLATGTDGGVPTVSLVYDKLALPAGGNFKYVVVLDPRPYPADGWPALRPLVAWNVGTPDYVPGLACVSDDNEMLGSAVMPLIPAGFGGGANYPDGTPAKMCIAQVGWTPVPGGIKYWVKVIDQSDSFVKFP